MIRLIRIGAGGGRSGDRQQDDRRTEQKGPQSPHPVIGTGAESIFTEVSEVDFSSKPFRLWVDDTLYTADAVIIATGASAQLLGLEGEMEYMGYGVSACATCDAFFFKNQEVAVVGGGDTAIEEATFLTKFAQRVTIIHRRDQLRASKIMQERARRNAKISFVWDSVVENIVGVSDNGRKRLTGLILRNVKTNEQSEFKADGLFIGIGHKPNTSLFKGILKMDETGYLLTEGKTTKTEIPGVFACGDVQDHLYRQAVTAAGSGCMAAIDAERYLEEIKSGEGR